MRCLPGIPTLKGSVRTASFSFLLSEPAISANGHGRCPTLPANPTGPLGRFCIGPLVVPPWKTSALYENAPAGNSTRSGPSDISNQLDIGRCALVRSFDKIDVVAGCHVTVPCARPNEGSSPFYLQLPNRCRW